MGNKVITMEKAIKFLKDGDTIMCGGFLGVGGPLKVIEEIIKNKIGNLTLIANDTAMPDKGIGKLIVNKLVRKAIVSHIGTNKETGNQMNLGELEVELSPQGTLIERIRAGGYGLGGVLTPTGIGTVVADGKEIINIDGKDFLLEKPLKANIAYIRASKGDKLGNLFLAKSTKNFNQLIAYAANLVIAEVEEIVEVGELEPDNIHVPHVLIDYIVEA